MGANYQELFSSLDTGGKHINMELPSFCVDPRLSLADGMHTRSGVENNGNREQISCSQHCFGRDDATTGVVLFYGGLLAHRTGRGDDGADRELRTIIVPLHT